MIWQPRDTPNIHTICTTMYMYILYSYARSHMWHIRWGMHLQVMPPPLPVAVASLARFHFGISLLFPYLTRAPSHQIFRRKPSIVACIAFLSKRLHSQAIVRHKVRERGRARGRRGVAATRLRMPIKNLNQFSIWISHNCIRISASVSGASASVAFSWHFSRFLPLFPAVFQIFYLLFDIARAVNARC